MRAAYTLLWHQGKTGEMFQLQRRVEYVLAIIAHLVSAGMVRRSARSISDQTSIPFDMVTKCSQRLKGAELCAAVQGKHGGYRLVVDLDQTSIGAALSAVFLNRRSLLNVRRTLLRLPAALWLPNPRQPTTAEHALTGNA